MMQHKSFGPVPPEVFSGLRDAPSGAAVKVLRKYDPLWARAPGEKIKWRVECSGKLYGTAYVEAATEKEAEKLADELTAGQVDWDDGSEDFDIRSIEAVG